MKNIYCVDCGKYRKFKSHKISYIFKKSFLLSTNCIKCENEDKDIFKEEESTEILRILTFIENI